MGNAVINTDAVNDTAKTVDELFEQFWKPIVCHPDGSLNIEQLKKELADYSFILGEVPKVYLAVTGDALSKPNYHAAGVISCTESHFSEMAKRDARDFIDYLVADEKMAAMEETEITELLNQYF